MPDHRLMPDICTLAVRAKKLGIVCPYPMGGTHLTLEAWNSNREHAELWSKPTCPTWGKTNNIRQKTLLDVPAETGKPLTAVRGHR